MSRVHLALSGNWVDCQATTRACPRKVHLDNTTVEAAGFLPPEMMSLLLLNIDEPAEERDGFKTWRDGQGRVHRDYGLPAIVEKDGMQIWYRHGKPYRANGLPTREDPDRHMWEDSDNLLHRGGGLPAIEYSDGGREWWVHGQRHRMRDLPAVEAANGDRMWWQHGKLHRINAPAIIYKDGTTGYYVRGKRETPFWA